MLININSKFNLNQEVYIVEAIQNKEKHFVGDPYIITEIRTIQSDQYTKIKYRLENQDKKHNRDEKYIFKTKEEALTECKILNQPSKIMNIADIQIPHHFKKNKPTEKKLMECYTHFKMSGTFDKYIVVNKDDILVDGYIRYLLCKMFDKEEIRVLIQE